MKCKCGPPVMTKICLVALVALLFFACSNESSSPPTPPAPPPFQPQTIVVQLGERGGATTLISTQSGGWTRNGQPFTSGSTVRGENSASYRLTLANGTWTAEFVAPEPEPLALGTSGDAVLLQVQEDGSFRLDGEAVTTGKVVMADNGNRYRLVLGSSGTWTAEFVPPTPQVVHLGTSGESRQVSRLEDGSHTVNGMALAPGAVIAAGNGSSYTLTLGADGAWAAEYVQPDPQPVQLGMSGDTPLLVYRLENGTYRLNDEPLLGGRIVEAANGNRYRLSLQDGIWQATYLASAVSVRLGTFGGSVSLIPQEDGTWRRGSSAFSSGDTVTGRNGFEYRLTLGADGGWIVEPLPMTVNVPTDSDTTIALSRLEDGSYRYDNRSVASGDTVQVGGSTYRLRFSNNRWSAQFLQGEIAVSLGDAGDSVTLIKNADGTYEYEGRRVFVRNGRASLQIRSPSTGIRYRLSLSNGVWSARVYVPPTVDPGGGGPGGGTPPVAADNILDALPAAFIEETDGVRAFDPDKNDDGITNAELVQAGIADATDSGGTTIDYSRYHGSGSFEDDTFVEAALREVNRVLQTFEDYRNREGTELLPSVARIVLDEAWPKVKAELDLLFGADQTPSRTFPAVTPKRSGETDVEEALDILEDLQENLSDVAKFKNEFKTLIDAAISTDSDVSGEKIFNARKRVLALGSSTNTRFGVIARLQSSTTTAVGVAGEPASYDSYAFAFSPLLATPTSALPSRGMARYSGRTWAIDNGDQVLYSGSIELLASLGIQQINATVSDLRRSDNNASWMRGNSNREVREVKLPEINHGQLDAAGRFTRSSAPSTVVYEEFGGLFDDQVDGSALEGQFVGTGQSAGIAVIGNWNVGTELEGSFGAERISTSSVRLPSAGSDLEFAHTPDSGLTIDLAAKTATIGSFLPAYSLSSPSDWNGRRDSTADSNLRATVRLRQTSLTRFGAWKVVDHSDSNNLTTSSKGVFAYSPLAAASYTDSDNNYPRRVRAVYRGSTVAIDSGDRLYSGSYVLTVQWGSDAVGGRMTAVISGSSLFSLGGDRVSQIGFDGNFTGVSPFSTLTTATVQYATGTREDLTGSSHLGHFLGEGIDGPYAVVGDWQVTKGDETVDGSFGANLIPAP